MIQLLIIVMGMRYDNERGWESEAAGRTRVGLPKCLFMKEHIDLREINKMMKGAVMAVNEL